MQNEFRKIFHFAKFPKTVDDFQAYKSLCVTGFKTKRKYLRV